jgi:HlyD family secretion protein
MAQLQQLKAGSREQTILQAEAELKAAEAKLAQMKGSSRHENVEIAVASFNLAVARLRELQEGPTPEQLEIAATRIRIAKNQLFAVQTQADAQIANVYSVYTKEMKEANAGVAWEQIRLAEAELAALEVAPKDTQVAQSQANVEIARQQLKLAESPFTQEEIAQAEASVEALRQQLELVREPHTSFDLKIAEARVNRAEAALEQAKQAREETVLRAPYAGIVARMLAHQGEVLAPGIPVVEFGDLSRLQVETTDLYEDDVSSIQEGQKAVITLYALEDEQITGTVTEIALKATLTAAGDANYTVIVLPDEQHPALRWGMTTNVELQGKQ